LFAPKRVNSFFGLFAVCDGIGDFDFSFCGPAGRIRELSRAGVTATIGLTSATMVAYKQKPQIPALTSGVR